jgi:hypothetical protein
MKIHTSRIWAVGKVAPVDSTGRGTTSARFINK